MTKILQGNFEKSFLKCEKKASRNMFWHFFHAHFFMFVLLTSNHTVFPVQFEINLHLWVFSKSEIALAEAARAISAFWKTHSCKLIPNWTRNRMITYTYISFLQSQKFGFNVKSWVKAFSRLKIYKKAKFKKSLYAIFVYLNGNFLNTGRCYQKINAIVAILEVLLCKKSSILCFICTCLITCCAYLST